MTAPNNPATREQIGPNNAAKSQARVESLSDTDVAEKAAIIAAAQRENIEAQNHQTNAECAATLRRHVIAIVQAWDARYSPEHAAHGVMIPAECVTMLNAADRLALQQPAQSAGDLGVREAAERLLSFRVGEQPGKGWLPDNDATQTALTHLSQALSASDDAGDIDHSGLAYFAEDDAGRGVG